MRDIPWIVEKLKVFDDPFFSFEPLEHVYRYGDRELTPVTSFIKNFCKPFDEPKWSKYKAKKRGVSVETILQEWKASKELGCAIGSEVHLYIENRFLEKPILTRKDFLREETLRRIDKFEVIYKERLYRLTPIAQELRIFSQRLGVAGTIDALFYIDGKLLILDWKTNKKFETDKHKCYDKMLAPFDSEWENEHNTYSVQLHLYKYILSEYGIKVDDCILVWVPGGDEPCQVHRCKDYGQILSTYFAKKFPLTINVPLPVHCNN